MRDQSIEEVFRLVDRDVWIVTSANNEMSRDAGVSEAPAQGGLVATWVNQASIDAHHPSVVVGVAVNHYTSDLIDASSAFGLHLLRPDQTDVALNFAIGSGRDREKLSGLATHNAKTGSPILQDCLAWLDCQLYYRFNGGDRIYYFADIVAGEIAVESETRTRPLTESQLFAAASDDQRAALKASLDSDILRQRPKYRAWREQLGDHPHPKFS